jgi:hypothetical protein
MMDVPMLTFLLVGIALYFGYLPGRRIYLLGAGLCFTLALGTGYTAAVPLLCLFAGLVAARRPWHELAAVAAAPAVLAVWLTIMTLHFGKFPLTEVAAYFASQGSRVHNLVATLSFLGGVVVFPWAVPIKRRRLIASLTVALLLSLVLPWPSLGHRLWYVALASFGAVLMIDFSLAARRLVASGKNSGEAPFILWFPAVLLFFVLVADMMNARYILLAVPALLLVIFREATQKHLIRLIIPTAGLSLVLAYGDFRFVNSYRNFVVNDIAPLQQQGFRIWSAAESGLRFYLEQAGAPTLTRQDLRPEPADLIVRHRELFRYSLAEEIETVLTTIKVFTLDDFFPVRTFNRAAAAGIHDSRVGIVPFTISLAPHDRLEIAQVSPFPDAVWSPTGAMLKQTEAERFFPIKVPANAAIEYDLDGTGTAELSAEGIRLKKDWAGTVIWRNFRIVPRQFATQATK